ncbi:hypothetical protein ACFQV2_32360 [Actinokineospora soli]|uniref:Thioesterase-like superfamily protein n=1 Tax=Actinokineospora soli TaxID=1048753 RepID=A0ABW2TU89_9PSEU
MLETLVQAARRALGRPDLGLAAVDAAVLRVLPPGPLTLRPTITHTPDGCAVAADGVAVRCARGAADAYPATFVLAAFARACSGPGPAEPLALRGVAVRGAARPGQVLAHRATARPDGSITGWTGVGGRRVLTVDRFAPGEAATTG